MSNCPSNYPTVEGIPAAESKYFVSTPSTSEHTYIQQYGLIVIIIQMMPTINDAYYPWMVLSNALLRVARYSINSFTHSPNTPT